MVKWISQNFLWKLTSNLKRRSSRVSSIRHSTFVLPPWAWNLLFASNIKCQVLLASAHTHTVLLESISKLHPHNTLTNMISYSIWFWDVKKGSFFIQRYHWSFKEIFFHSHISLGNGICSVLNVLFNNSWAYSFSFIFALSEVEWWKIFFS